MSLLQSIITLLTTAVGALMQGVTGLGLNLFASPILMMVEPRLVPGPILAGALLLTGLMLLRDRSAIDVRGVAWMAAGMLPGTILSSFLLPVIPHKALALLLGGLVLAGVAISLSGFHFPAHAWILFLAGFVSGAGTVLASIGGPPVALVNQSLEPRKLRGTLSSYFFLSGIVALAGLVPAGRMGSVELGFSVWVLAGVALGFVASGVFINKMNATTSRYVVLALSGASAVILILQQVL